MTLRASASFTVTGWDEGEILPREGATRVTRAQVSYAYSGDLVASSEVAYLMAYQPQRSQAPGEPLPSSDFVGVERISGALLGREGSFVLRHVGRYDGAATRAAVTVVEGSGTGALAGLTGAGRVEAVHGGACTLDLEASLPEAAGDAPGAAATPGR